MFTRLTPWPRHTKVAFDPSKATCVWGSSSTDRDNVIINQVYTNQLLLLLVLIQIFFEVPLVGITLDYSHLHLMPAVAEIGLPAVQLEETSFYSTLVCQ